LYREVRHSMKRHRLLIYAAVLVSSILWVGSCAFILDTIRTGGEKELKPAPPSGSGSGLRMIIFALDGTTPAQLMEAIRSGKAPNLAGLLGRERGRGLFEHGYAAPRALSILPSSTIAAWSAIFTGTAPALNGVVGDEWFERESGTFLAPVPVSALDTADVTKVVTDDLIGKELQTPTLYELIKKNVNVAMLSVHRGASLSPPSHPHRLPIFLDS